MPKKPQLRPLTSKQAALARYQRRFAPNNNVAEKSKSRLRFWMMPDGNSDAGGNSLMHEKQK